MHPFAPFIFLIFFAVRCAGAERRERHRGSEGVRAGDGEGVPHGSQGRPEDQSQRHSPRRHSGGGRLAEAEFSLSLPQMNLRFATHTDRLLSPGCLRGPITTDIHRKHSLPFILQPGKTVGISQTGLYNFSVTVQVLRSAVSVCVEVCCGLCSYLRPGLSFHSSHSLLLSMRSVSPPGRCLMFVNSPLTLCPTLLQHTHIAIPLL